jgi:epoxide hydrolase-like predicted phosphatase
VSERALICDFGGVLTTPLIEAIGAHQRESGISLEEVGEAMARIAEADGGHPLFELEKGKITEADFIARLDAELGRPIGPFGAYFRQLDRNEPMIDYVRQVRGRGIRTALLTNNIREWESGWRAKLPEIDQLFEVVVDSSAVGMRKPEREIYELTLKRLGGGVDAKACVFVDDTDVNCEAARELGMRAVLFESAEQAIAEIEQALS